MSSFSEHICVHRWGPGMSSQKTVTSSPLWLPFFVRLSVRIAETHWAAGRRKDGNIITRREVDMPISEEERVPEAVCSDPELPGHTVQQDDLHHTWIIDQTLIPCTKHEYVCLKLLLEHANSRVSFTQLARCLPGTALKEGADQRLERMRVRHLMSGLRSKLWKVGMDIVSLRGLGYMLQLEMQEETTA